MDPLLVELGVAFNEKIQGKGQKLDNFVVGKVVSISPITVSIDEAIMAYHYQIYALENALPNFSSRITYQTSGTSTGTLTYIDNLKVGDQLALIPSANYQQYLILGKVVSL